MFSKGRWAVYQLPYVGGYQKGGENLHAEICLLHPVTSQPIFELCCFTQPRNNHIAQFCCLHAFIIIFKPNITFYCRPAGAGTILRLRRTTTRTWSTCSTWSSRSSYSKTPSPSLSRNIKVQIDRYTSKIWNVWRGSHCKMCIGC